MPSHTTQNYSQPSAYQHLERVGVNHSSASHSAAHTATAAATFNISENVRVWYQDAWLPGVIVGGLHTIDRSNHLGYTVKVLVQRGRYMEVKFPQEYVKAAPDMTGYYT